MHYLFDFCTNQDDKFKISLNDYDEWPTLKNWDHRQNKKKSLISLIFNEL